VRQGLPIFQGRRRHSAERKSSMTPVPSSRRKRSPSAETETKMPCERRRREILGNGEGAIWGNWKRGKEEPVTRRAGRGCRRDPWRFPKGIRWRLWVGRRATSPPLDCSPSLPCVLETQPRFAFCKCLKIESQIQIKSLSCDSFFFYFVLSTEKKNNVWNDVNGWELISVVFNRLC
jgi:hypothetical protein